MPNGNGDTRIWERLDNHGNRLTALETNMTNLEQRVIEEGERTREAIKGIREPIIQLVIKVLGGLIVGALIAYIATKGG